MTDPLISEQVFISIFLPSIFKVDYAKDSICKTWDSYAPINANDKEVRTTHTSKKRSLRSTF